MQTTRTWVGLRRRWHRAIALPAAGAGLATVLVAGAVGCHPPMRPTIAGPPPPSLMAELWVEPEPDRDLFCGVGGCGLAPDPDARYRIIDVKQGGFSDGFTLLDPDGREWSAKLLPEGRTEVVASRLFWGLGYRQPPIYYLETWHAENPTSPNPQVSARFREKAPAFHGLEEDEEWSYYQNPFVGTTPLNGLLVLHVMLGSSDLKDSNNSIYTFEDSVGGVRRWYVARDIGQTFGRAEIFGAPRGDIDAFESTGFIEDVENGRVKFDWGGRHGPLVDHIAPRDVRWICERLDRLTDRQWHDAFRAGGFNRSLADRFIKHLEWKVAQGLALQDP